MVDYTKTAPRTEYRDMTTASKVPNPRVESTAVAGSSSERHFFFATITISGWGLTAVRESKKYVLLLRDAGQLSIP